MCDRRRGRAQWRVSHCLIPPSATARELPRGQFTTQHDSSRKHLHMTRDDGVTQGWAAYAEVGVARAQSTRKSPSHAIKATGEAQTHTRPVSPPLACVARDTIQHFSVHVLVTRTTRTGQTELAAGRPCLLQLVRARTVPLAPIGTGSAGICMRASNEVMVSCHCISRLSVAPKDHNFNDKRDCSRQSFVIPTSFCPIFA